MCVRVALATSDVQVVQSILDIPATDEIHMEDRLVRGQPHLNKEIRKLTLRRRANARNVSFRISLRWLTYIVNSVDKTKLSYI